RDGADLQFPAIATRAGQRQLQRQRPAKTMAVGVGIAFYTRRPKTTMREATPFLAIAGSVIHAATAVESATASGNPVSTRQHVAACWQSARQWQLRGAP